MGLLSNLFNGKNQIDEKFKEIIILESIMRQKEAQTQTRLMISNLMQNPSLINGMKMYGEFGSYLTNQLNNFQQTDELQFITELAFFVISKRLNREIHPFNLFFFFFIKSVCIGVGPIAFTVILKGLNSFEAVCVKVSMAALLEA